MQISVWEKHFRKNRQLLKVFSSWKPNLFWNSFENIFQVKINLKIIVSFHLMKVNCLDISNFKYFEYFLKKVLTRKNNLFYFFSFQRKVIDNGRPQECLKVIRLPVIGSLIERKRKLQNQKTWRPQTCRTWRPTSKTLLRSQDTHWDRVTGSLHWNAVPPDDQQQTLPEVRKLFIK